MKFQKTLVAITCTTALMSGSLFAASDKLTIGMSQYPPTIHPDIDSSVAKTYINGFTLFPTMEYAGDHI